MSKHGIHCQKVLHLGDGYMHAADDDGPFDVDGVSYCGRCHFWLGASATVAEAPEQDHLAYVADLLESWAPLINASETHTIPAGKLGECVRILRATAAPQDVQALAAEQRVLLREYGACLTTGCAERELECNGPCNRWTALNATFDRLVSLAGGAKT